MEAFTTIAAGFSARWTRFLGAMLSVALITAVTAIAAPGIPVLASPTNGALNQPLSLALTWGSVATATSYGVQVSTSSSFATTVLSQTGLTATFVTVSGLAINTKYYWSANASNGSGASLWATTASFTTITSQRAPVDLGTAGNFVILAKSGISATGTTSIVGNIGVSPIAATAITGFGLIMDPSGTFSTSSLVTGKVYAADYTSPTPSNLTTAVSNMETAYTDAAGRPTPDFTELYSGDVTGKTLAPGLYKWGTGVLISAAGVTISGSATDIWIFQIAQDLTMANGAIVTLTGGAQASNIFWQVAGQVTLGTTAAMKGIILCKTQVAMSTGAALNGRALAQTAVTLDGNAVTYPIAAPVLTSPTNGSGNQPLSVNLSWGSVTGAISYQVQVSLSSTFASTLFSQSGTTMTNASVNGLANNTTYYWHATASNAGVTSWSATWSFTTIVAAPATPVLASPTNGAGSQPLSPGLSWGSAARATSYEVQVSLTSTFAATVFDQSGATLTSATASGLVNGTTCFWRVNASNVGGTSWSATWSFTTIVAAPAAPALASPTNGAGSLPLSPGLSWGSSARATSYEVQVSLSSTFAATVFDRSGATLTNATASGLVNGTTYFWRVNASNIGGTSWSNTWSFTTIVAVSAAPGLVSPTNGANNLATALTLSWTSASGAASYTVQISTVSTYANTVFIQTGTSLTAAVSGLTYGGITYYWRAGATNAAGTTWANSWRFITLAVPAVPTLVSPSNTALFTNGQPLTVTWATVATATLYTVQVSMSSSFGTTTFSQTGLTTSFRFTPTRGTMNYWRVSATNAAGTSVWSSVWRLTPSVSAIPSALQAGTYAFSLKQSTIAYSLPKTEQVELSVCDIRGKTAMTLSIRQTVGSYSMNLKRGTLAAGLYIVRFKAGSFEKHVSMMLTR